MPEGRLSFRQMLRVFRDLFSSRSKNRSKREQKNSRTLQEKKTLRGSSAKKEGKQEVRLNIPNEADIKEQETIGNHSLFDTDLDDEVFADHEIHSTPLENNTLASDDEGSRMFKLSHRDSTKSLPVRTKPVPTIVQETLNRQHIIRNSVRQKTPRDSISESELAVGDTSAASNFPTSIGRLFFPSDKQTPGNSPEIGQNKSPFNFRNNTVRKSSIKVKYTKVYGEIDGAYKNDSVPRGLVFMCNFSKFDDNRKYRERVGSEQDYDNLLDLFQQMGYGHRRRKNKYCQTGYITKKEFMERLRAFSRDKKHQMSCSCIIILMSHGSGPKTLVTSDNQEVDLMEVYSIFDNINCKLLKDKPKIFILQFCRSISQEIPRTLDNQSVDEADWLRKLVREELHKFLQSEHQQLLNLHNSTEYINPKSPNYLVVEEITRKTSLASLSSALEANVSQATERPNYQGHHQQPNPKNYQVDTRNLPRTPSEGVQRYSDMYSIFSTSPGELSHRDPRKGSLLIQAICHVFAENAYHYDIDTLVRKVSTYMTKTLQKDDPMTVPRQTCERTNNGLDKLFYFNPHELTSCRHVTI